MIQEGGGRIQRQIRSPRSAAIAGIIFFLQMTLLLFLTTDISGMDTAHLDEKDLEQLTQIASRLLILIPFAGIAFLWFTGVIRDHLGAREDRFFATIFLSSGIIIVVLLFIWGAIFGALVATRTYGLNIAPDNAIYLFGFSLMNLIIRNYTVRMAGVYMTAIGSLWTRAGLMPPWLSIITFVLAIGYLAAAERIRESFYIFPSWVLLMSIYILILNYRKKRSEENDEDTPLQV